MRRPVRHAFIAILAVAMQLVIASSAAAAPTFLSFAENTSPQYQHAVGSTMWINPLFGGGFTVSAEESAGDTTSLVFPSLGAGWIGGGSVVPTGATETMNYDWTPAPANPGAVLITSNPSATTVGFTVAADPIPAAGGSILYPGATNAPSATVTFATGSDADSGIATWQLQRRVAPLMGDICSGYSAYANVGPANPAGPTFSDATIVSGNCYQYRLVVTDNVGNDAIFSSAVDLKVDTTLPSGTIDAMPVSPFAGSVTLTGSSSDAHTSVTSIAVTYAGPSSGTACSGLAGASWSCSWDTTALPDGTYTLTATFTDTAGNTSTVTRSVILDN
ncbi:MAG: Laminin sub domain 2, partial [Thermoleophilia bacterium]|nr:Laminin sub domain 2 [Thermoleophilia bacterium]